MSTGDSTPDDETPGAAVRLVKRLKGHPVMVVLGGLVAVVTLAGTVVGYAQGLYGEVDKRANPYRADYDNLAALELGQTSEAVERHLGGASSTSELCAVVPCPAGAAADDFRLHTHQLTDGAVSAVYSGDQLVLYAVTTRAEGFRPEIRWRSERLGELGAKAFAELGEPAKAPTDISVALTPKFAAYAETFAFGAPGNYVGLLLARMPGGADVPIDLDSASAIGGSGGLDTIESPEAWARFRDSSTPNAYGVFRDDGAIATIARDASNVMSILLDSDPTYTG